jgi:predicted HicB family RNase H-like nuclease
VADPNVVDDEGFGDFFAVNKQSSAMRRQAERQATAGRLATETASVQVNLRVTPSFKALVDSAARRDGLPLTRYIVRVIEEYEAKRGKR